MTDAFGYKLFFFNGNLIRFTCVTVIFMNVGIFLKGLIFMIF